MAYIYRTVKVNGKTKLLHRHLMEQHLGRALRRDEHVHHINGDRYDNRIENLEVVSALTHMRERHGRLKHPVTKTCGECGAVFTPHPTKRARQRACSRPCAYSLGWARRRANAGAVPADQRRAA
jgi:hypothetical protein